MIKPKAAAIAMSPTKMTTAEIERYLWGAATILRNHVRSADYQGFVYPLVFFKFLSDRADEARAEALAESNGDEAYAVMPEHYEWAVPKGCHWPDLRATTTDIGSRIIAIFGALEKANPKLSGVFGSIAPWTNKDKVSDETLAQLIEQLSSVTLDSKTITEDQLGTGYEYLIKEFASDGGHSAQEFYTNRTVVHLMTELLDVSPGESVYDPTCGTAGMLISAASHLRARGQDPARLRLYGQEIKPEAAAIARTNLYLHGIREFEIAVGDTLLAPRFLDGDGLRTFDVVLANPPYSMPLDRDFWSQESWGRNIYGIPSAGNADYAFFEHILASLDPRTGRSATLWPHGILFRSPEIRAKILKEDLVEGVIGLGPNLFYNSSMESCVVICRSRKLADRSGKIILIDASKEVSRDGKQAFLSREHIDHIVATYFAFKSVPGYAAVVNRNDLSAPDYSLRVRAHVIATELPDGISLEVAVKDWRAAVSKLRQVAKSSEVIGK
jgi:type I restriction enzyme M protein